MDEDASKKSDEFWTQNRHDSLTHREKKIFKMIPYENITFWANSYDNDAKDNISQFIKYIFEID